MERLLGASHERKCSVFAVMKNPAFTASLQAKAREAISGFVEFVERTRNSLINGSLMELAGPSTPNLSLANWAERFLIEIDYVSELRRSEKTPEAAESRIRNVKDMVGTLDQAGDGRQLLSERLQDFLEQMTLDTEREEENENPGDAVTLITMHSCKGLEFPHVYIVGMEQGLLPHARSITESTLDEERRLFYVAVTRAMQTLTISHCAARKRYGQKLPRHPSQFLSDLPAEFIEDADEQARKPVAPESSKDLFAVMRDVVG
jgi:superfamily I DNA/RNA helicase